MKLQEVDSLSDLWLKANESEDYQKLVTIASQNLGSAEEDHWKKYHRWLEINAMETNEMGVVDEVNFCIDIAQDLVDKGNKVS